MMINQNVALQEKLDSFLDGRCELSVLEAGCGSTSHIVLKNVAILTGIDISKKQLERNPLIQEKIFGDLQTTSLGTECYDVIVSWDVLEHLESPDKALLNLYEALNVGGILVIAAPVCCSLKGLVSKLLPHKAHVLFYRYVFGDTLAGKDDHGPFKCYLRSDMWPANIKKSALMNNLKVAYYSQYEGPVSQSLRARSRLFGWLTKVISVISRFLSWGRFDATESDFILVLTK